VASLAQATCILPAQSVAFSVGCVAKLVGRSNSNERVVSSDQNEHEYNRQSPMSVLAGQPAAAAMAEASGIWHTALAEMKPKEGPLPTRVHGWAEDGGGEGERGESTSEACWSDDTAGNQLLLPMFFIGSSSGLPLVQMEVRMASRVQRTCTGSDSDEEDNQHELNRGGQGTDERKRRGYECHWGAVLGVAELSLSGLSARQLASLRRRENGGCTCRLPLTDLRGR
jgi:hypothetical protein